MPRYEELLSFALAKNDNKMIMEIYEKIYYDYVKLVSFSVGKYIKEEETIKDITNDVFVAFFNNVNNVKTSIKYYLLNTARNLSLNYLMKFNRIQRLDDENIIMGSYPFDSNSKYIELIDDLNKVLSEEEVKLIIYHVVDGYTFNELEKILNLPSKTINKRYERAIKKFRKTR